MAVTVKKAVLWRRGLENRPGTLAETLRPLAEAKVNLHIVMGYQYPADRDRSAVEVYPISGAKSEQAAAAAGLSRMTQVHCLVVEGDDAPGLGHNMSAALSEANININFCVIQVL